MVFLSANSFIHNWNIGKKDQISSQNVSFYLRIQYSRSKKAGRIYRKYRGPPVLTTLQCVLGACLVVRNNRGDRNMDCNAKNNQHKYERDSKARWQLNSLWNRDLKCFQERFIFANFFWFFSQITCLKKFSMMPMQTPRSRPGREGGIEAIFRFEQKKKNFLSQNRMMVQSH